LVFVVDENRKNLPTKINLSEALLMSQLCVYML